MKKLLLLPVVLLLISSQKANVGIAYYIADLKKTSVEMYWKDQNGVRYATLGNLKKHIESRGKKVLCAMNAGMFQKDFSPQGLFIARAKKLSELDVSDAAGNFYLKPNGVFYITSDAKAHICETSAFRPSVQVAFATQSGPMLVVDAKIHEAFKQASTNVNVRNGVGILPDGNVIFAISNGPINLFDFAKFFKNAGCRNALYLDGFVSRAYIPSEKKHDLDGNFGPMVAVISKD